MSVISQIAKIRQMATAATTSQRQRRMAQAKTTVEKNRQIRKTHYRVQSVVIRARMSRRL